MVAHVIGTMKKSAHACEVIYIHSLHQAKLQNCTKFKGVPGQDNTMQFIKITTNISIIYHNLERCLVTSQIVRAEYTKIHNHPGNKGLSCYEYLDRTER